MLSRIHIIFNLLLFFSLCSMVLILFSNFQMNLCFFSSLFSYFQTIISLKVYSFSEKHYISLFLRFLYIYVYFVIFDVYQNATRELQCSCFVTEKFYIICYLISVIFNQLFFYRKKNQEIISKFRLLCPYNFQH